MLFNLCLFIVYEFEFFILGNGDYWSFLNREILKLELCLGKYLEYFGGDGGGVGR